MSVSDGKRFFEVLYPTLKEEVTFEAVPPFFHFACGMLVLLLFLLVLTV